MGVECGVPVVLINQERFHEIDRIVIGQSFALQNELGRFFDERIYQNELSMRCSDLGMNVQREVLLRISHRHFQKDYFIEHLGCRFSLGQLSVNIGQWDFRVLIKTYEHRQKNQLIH